MPFWIVPRILTLTVIIVTLFHSQATCWYFPSFLLSFDLQVDKFYSSYYIKLVLVFWLRLDGLFISKDPKEFCVSFFFLVKFCSVHIPFISQVKFLSLNSLRITFPHTVMSFLEFFLYQFAEFTYPVVNCFISHSLTLSPSLSLSLCIVYTYYFTFFLSILTFI